MILFQEQFFDLENSGTDNLPDSAYFAHLSRPSMGGREIDPAIINRITQLEAALSMAQESITALTERIEVLETKTNHREITEKEYANLSNTEKMKDITYFVS